MTKTITFPARFNGGPGFAQGGYLAGTMAELVGGPARTTFRAPTPVETPLAVERDGAVVRLVTSNGTVTVTAEPCSLDIEVPGLPDYKKVVAARPNFKGFQSGSMDSKREAKDTCFVCGTKRHRPDGVELYAAPVGDGSLVASTWLPEEQYAENGLVRNVFLAAVLDCPAGFGAMERITDDYDLIFTGQMAVKFIAPVRAGEEHIVMGWHQASERRKHAAASAICDLNGNVKAISDSLWIVTNTKA